MAAQGYLFWCEDRPSFVVFSEMLTNESGYIFHGMLVQRMQNLPLFKLHFRIQHGT